MMASRTILGQSSIVALALALVFTPLAAAADDLPQSDSVPADSSGQASNTDKREAGETPERDTSGGEDLAPAFDATYLELISEVAEDNPDFTLGEISEEVGLPIEGPMSPIHSGEMLSVSITFAEAPTSQDVAGVEAYAQVRRVLDVAPIVMGYADPLALSALRELPGVVEVEVNLAPDTTVVDRELTKGEERLLSDAIAEAKSEEVLAGSSGARASCRSLPAAANGPLKVTEASEEWGVDGTGVKVGILSSTYDEDTTASTTPA